MEIINLSNENENENKNDIIIKKRGRPRKYASKEEQLESYRNKKRIPKELWNHKGRPLKYENDEDRLLAKKKQSLESSRRIRENKKNESSIVLQNALTEFGLLNQHNENNILQISTINESSIKHRASLLKKVSPTMLAFLKKYNKGEFIIEGL